MQLPCSASTKHHGGTQICAQILSDYRKAYAECTLKSGKSCVAKKTENMPSMPWQHAAPFPPSTLRGEQIGEPSWNCPGHVVLVDATAEEALLGGTVGNARDKMILVHV